MAQQWLSASDPYWSQFGNVAGRDPESGEFTNPYITTIRGLEAPENWRNVARQLGYRGPFETQYISSDPGEGGGGYATAPAPEFLQFIQQKKAEGYDFVTKADQINKDRQTIGLRTPTGEVINQTPVKVSGFGDFFKEFVLPAAGIAFGMGGLNSLMGGAAAAPANALAGIAEGMIPGGLTAAGIPATAAELAAVGALTGAAPLTAADIGRGLGDVMGQVSQAPAVEVMDLAPLESAVTNVTTPAAVASDAAAAMQLRPMTQLQPIMQQPNALAGTAADLVGGSADLAGAMGGGQFSAAGMAPAASAGLSAEALDAALAGAGGGATAGRTAAQALGGSLQAGTTPGALGSVIGSTGAGTAIAAGAAPTILDQAIDLLKSPAGQAVVGGVGSVVGGVMQAEAAKDVAAQQATAAENALKLQKDMFEYQQSLLAPYRKAGEAALERLTGAMGLGGPAQAQQMLEMDPGYGFRLGEGMKALERMQAARGNMLSGGALKAGQRYAQDFASGEYSNAYNRLANIAGLGQTAGTQLGAAGERFAQGAGQTGMEAANALAAGRIGRASAYTGGIQGGLNAYQNYLNRQREEQLFRDIFGRTTVGP